MIYYVLWNERASLRIFEPEMYCIVPKYLLLTVFVCIYNFISSIAAECLAYGNVMYVAVFILRRVQGDERRYRQDRN